MNVECPWLPISLPQSSATRDVHPEILRVCPDAHDVVSLRGGAVNQCFRVSTQKGNFAFRLGVDDPAKYGFNREKELAFYREAENLGIAPPLTNADPAKGILVMQFVDGHVVSKESIRHPGVLTKVIDLIKALHSVESSEMGAGKTIEHIHFFMGKLREHNALLECWEKSVTQAIEKMPAAKKLVLCHNDLAFNLMEDTLGRIWAIDFECAGWNNPVFDLAFLCIWYEFSEQEKIALLEAYPIKITLAELHAAICLGLLFSALWSRLEVVYGNTSYESQAQELYDKAIALV